MKVSKHRPAHWPALKVDDKGRALPVPEQSWTDAWGKHVLKDGTLTTDYAEPAPVRVVSKRKHRRP